MLAIFRKGLRRGRGHGEVQACLIGGFGQGKELGLDGGHIIVVKFHCAVAASTHRFIASCRSTQGDEQHQSAQLNRPPGQGGSMSDHAAGGTAQPAADRQRQPDDSQEEGDG